MKKTRSKLSNSYRCRCSEQISNRIETLDQYKKAKRVALYQAINGEVDLSLVWKNTVDQEKQCYFPVLKDDLSLLFLPATPKTEFKANKYNILEPVVDIQSAIEVSDLDIIFMPLVAFDVMCNRIGMGAGYYDRTLENKKKCKLYGVAYQFQRVDYIESDSWDVPLDSVITQRAIYWRETPQDDPD